MKLENLDVQDEAAEEINGIRQGDTEATPLFAG